MNNSKNSAISQLELLETLHDFSTEFAIANNSGTVEALVRDIIGNRSVINRIINDDVGSLLLTINGNARMLEFIKRLTVRFRLLFVDNDDYLLLLNTIASSISKSGFSNHSEYDVMEILTGDPCLVPLMFIADNYFNIVDKEDN